jgi:hypothetical protein
MSLKDKGNISVWQVMSSNAGYYVGRDEDGFPYDRRSGYFKTWDEANQELCGMSDEGHITQGEGRCGKCSQLVLVGLFIKSLKAKPTVFDRKKLLNGLTKSELDKVCKVLQVNPLIKTKAGRIRMLCIPENFGE